MNTHSRQIITLHLTLTLLKQLKYSIIYNFITKSFINYNQLFRMNVLNFTVLIYNDNINSPDGGMARVVTTSWGLYRHLPKSGMRQSMKKF